MPFCCEFRIADSNFFRPRKCGGVWLGCSFAATWNVDRFGPEPEGSGTLRVILGFGGFGCIEGDVSGSLVEDGVCLGCGRHGRFPR